MKKLYSFIFTVLVFSLISCNTLKQSGVNYESLDYSQRDFQENEKKRIKQIEEKKYIEALWRAYLLGDKKLLDEQKEITVNKIYKNIEEKNYFIALKDYLSLKRIDEDFCKSISINEKDLVALNKIELPGYKVDKNLLPKNLTECLDATVTIWVDKGISIKNGVGYADRVLGSGFFIDKRGYIITNHHVINDLVDPKYEGYSRLYIKLNKDSENRIPAKVIGYDSVLDLALLKCEIDPPFVFELGSSKDLVVGDKVNAIGTPLGLQGTITSGIISSTDRKLFSMGDVLQIDAAVNSGNSGGPLIDANRKVQAVVFAGIMQYQGLNFAIPVEYLLQDLPFLYQGGKRTHSWIGAYGHTKKDGYLKTGLEIQYVLSNGPCFRAGLKAGDVITFIEDKRVNSLEDFQSVIRNYTYGSIIKCSFLRDNNSMETVVYLDKRPDQPGYEIYTSDLITQSFIPIFGMGLVHNSTISSRKFSVSSIINGSIADESGFSETDPITIYDIDFDEEKTSIYIQLMTKRKKKGYIDISIGLSAMLDSPYYF